MDPARRDRGHALKQGDACRWPSRAAKRGFVRIFGGGCLSQTALAVENQLPDHFLFVALVETSVADGARSVVVKADALLKAAPAQGIMTGQLSKLQYPVIRGAHEPAIGPTG